MGGIFLDDEDDKVILKPGEWRHDPTYRKAYCGRAYANVENAKLAKSSSKTIYVFKINTKILVNTQTRLVKFKSSDLIKTIK